MNKILNFPSPNEWTYDGVPECSVTVTDNDKPLTVETVNYLLDMAKQELLEFCKGES